MADEKPKRLSPTVIMPPVTRVPRVKPAATAPVAAKTPTAIAGVERKRIDVSVEALAALVPGTPRATCEAACRLIQDFNAETATERRVMLWGVSVQKAYAEHMARVLEFAQSPVFTRVESHIARALKILETVDVLPALGFRGGGISRIFAGAGGRIDTPNELATALEELQRLTQLMEQALHDLLSGKDRLLKFSADIETIARDADAHALAALFLSNHVNAAKPALASKFLNRSLSLGQTFAQIKEQGAVHDLHKARPDRLVEAVQNVALVSLPDFLSTLATLTTLKSHAKRVSETDARELDFKLRSIIDQIKQ